MANKKTENKQLRECSFNPNEYTVEIINSFNNQPEKYLPVNRRVEWFLVYCNENGIEPYIDMEHVFNERTWQYLATVKILMNGEVIAVDSAAKTYNPKDPKTYAALMSAITAAKGRALANCGFGTCMTGIEETDKIPVDTGVPFNTTAAMSVNEENIEDVPASQFDMSGYFEGIEAEDEFAFSGAPVTPAPAAMPTPAEATKPMTLEEAQAFICPIGAHKGQTLGSITATDPNMILFYADKYSGTRYKDLVIASKIIKEAVM